MNPNASKKWVDTHFHVFNAGKAIEDARYVPHYAATLPDWIAKASRVGVTRGVWVQPSFLGVDNSLMLSALKVQPDVLRGIAVVNANTSLDELQSMHVYGVRGIRLNLAGLSHDIPEWIRADNMWQALHGLGWHVEVHTDQGALPHVLNQLPTDMPLVVDHMAKPAEARVADASIRALVRRGQQTPTYIKLSGSYRLGGVDATNLAHIWLNELGVNALLWGSDWPCTNHEHLADYDALFASLEAWVGLKNFAQVLIHNPDRLYDF